MSRELNILATVRNPGLLEAALLVFKTVRVGFPNARICVRGNGLEWYAAPEVKRAADAVGAQFRNMPYCPHDAWIEMLVGQAQDPFWICDTDVVFFDELEHCYAENSSITLAGRYEPEFDENWTGTIHVARLHTALMYFNPAELRIQARQWMSKIPPPWGLTAQMNLFRQTFVPLRGTKTLFYDTCAGLWHCGLGTAFGPYENESFEHLHCATYVDLAGEAIGLPDMAQMHKKIYAQPKLARGIQKMQAEYYAKRRRPGSTLVVGEQSAKLE